MLLTSLATIRGVKFPTDALVTPKQKAINAQAQSFQSLKGAKKSRIWNLDPTA
jgi:hypothetical protein